jgi:protein-disulfide isomerase-like protein with CxxC motif
MSASVHITHFTDPGCPWAYSASPDLAALQWRYGEQLEWQLVTIGLTESYEQYVQRGYTPDRMAISQLSFRRFGMPFNPMVRQRPQATAPACKAIVATRELHPDREHAVFRALQFTWHTTDALMDTPAGIERALAMVDGVDAGAVLAASESAAVAEAYEADRAHARSAAGTPTEAQGKSATSDGPVRYTAPSLVLRQGDRCLEAGGFQSLPAYDVCVANLDTSLRRRPPAEQAADAVGAFPDGLTTQEVAAIMTPDLAPLDRRRAETELLQAVAAGTVSRTPLGDDALWRPA